VLVSASSEFRKYETFIAPQLYDAKIGPYSGLNQNSIRDVLDADDRRCEERFPKYEKPWKEIF